MVGRRGQSEGIMAGESTIEEGEERRQLDTFVDPREVPRSGNFFEVRRNVTNIQYNT